MVSLVEVTEENWLAAARLRVSEEQKHFVASAVGILARAYVYRECRAKVYLIEAGNTVVGMMMVRDMDEEPCCYELQQFLVDEKQQGKGYGYAALTALLELLSGERKYPCVEVCVKMTDAAALHVYEKAGFQDTGYIDDDVPDSYNLMYNFERK